MAQEGSLKRGKTLNGPIDLISKLPRGVIDLIMEHLSLCDVARMSVLSHKWRNIWRTIPKLVLDAQFFSGVLKDKILDPHEFSRIVSNVLFYHSGHVLKFHLNIPPLKSCPDVDPWICYLSRGGVSDINIQNQFTVALKLNSIFSCDNLEKLKLSGVIILPPHNFGGFRKMTCLELDKTAISEKSFSHLIKNCPLLQKLRITNCVGMNRIVIDLPNLSHLIVDSMYISLDVRNAENLVLAVFGLHYWYEATHSTCLRVLIKSLASSCKLQKLVFKGQFCKAFLKEPLLPPAFDKLRKLDLSSIFLNDADEFYSIINAIQSCPAIKRLYISVTESRHSMFDTVDYNPDVVLHFLCYIDLSICCGSKIELKLIEFLLACSPVLNKLSITSTSDAKTVFQPKTMIQLIRFRRASQKAEVIIDPF